MRNGAVKIGYIRTSTVEQIAGLEARKRQPGLTVHEPDDGVVHFARWRPFDQNAVSRSAVPAPAREEDRVGIWGAGDRMAHPGAAGEQLPEAAQ